jgi:hypothetical protein
MQMVNDRVLSSLILQMAVFSAIEATERTLGLGSFSLRGQIEFQQGIPPLKLDNVYAGDFSVPMQAALGVATPLAYAQASGFDALKVKNIALSIDASERKRILQIDQVTASRKEVHPGDTVDLTVVFAGENGAEVQRTASYTVPVGAPSGSLSFTVGDATSMNLAEYTQLIGVTPKSPAQLITFLNALRPNTSAYVRVGRTDPAFQVQGLDMPDPPPSLALILSRSPSIAATALLARGSKIAELAIDLGDAVVTGSKSTQVEVKD